MAIQTERRLFTVNEYHRMLEVYSSPKVGTYQQILQAHRGDSLPLPIGVASLSVDTILG